MSGELDELAAAVAGMLVSALAGDSWQDAQQWYANVIGHEGRLAATRAELATAADGRARDLVVQEQVRAWTVRLRDVFEDSPATARTLRDLVAGLRAQGLFKPAAATSQQAGLATAPVPVAPEPATFVSSRSEPPEPPTVLTATPPTAPVPAGGPPKGRSRSLIAAGIAVVVVAAAVIASWQAGLFGSGASPQLRPLAWTGTQPPLPDYAAALSSSANSYDPLYSVSCPAAGTCLAVGQLTPHGGSGWRPLVERLANGTWAPEQAQPPLPADADSVQSSGLYYIVCSSPSACTAAGAYSTSAATGGNPNAGLIETLSGTTWTPVSVPLPSGAGRNNQAELNGVACPVAGGCIAVGANRDIASNGTFVSSQPLIAMQIGGTWKSAEAPLPPDAATRAQQAYLEFVACTGLGTCTVVGVYTDKSGNQQGLVETVANDHWTAARAPLPKNAAAKPAVDLWGISCPSSTCVAVGDYHAGAKEEALIETLPNGRADSAQAQSLPLTGSESSLNTVYCVSASSCLALGGYGGAGLQSGLAATLTDGTWSTTPVPLPADAATEAQKQNVALWGVACPSAASCQAVGSYATGTGSVMPLTAVGTAGATTPGTAAPAASSGGAQPGATGLPLGEGTFQIKGTVTEFDPGRQSIALQGTVDGLALAATGTGNGLAGGGFAGQGGYCGSIGLIGSAVSGTLGGVPLSVTLTGCTADSGGTLTVTYTGTWGSRPVNITLTTAETGGTPPTLSGTIGGQQVSGTVPQIVTASGAPGQTAQISGTITVS